MGNVDEVCFFKNDLEREVNGYRGRDKDIVKG